jgi:hypothetical protein
MTASRFFEIAVVLVRFNHLASIIINADHSITRAAAMLRVSDCVGDFEVPQPTEWERFGNRIEAAFIFARDLSTNAKTEIGFCPW